MLSIAENIRTDTGFQSNAKGTAICFHKVQHSLSRFYGYRQPRSDENTGAVLGTETVPLDPSFSRQLTLALPSDTYPALPGMGPHTHRHGSPGCPLYMSPSAGLLQCSPASSGAPCG